MLLKFGLRSLNYKMAPACDLQSVNGSSALSVCSFVINNSDICEGGGYMHYTQFVFCQSETALRVLTVSAFILLLLQLFIALSVAADSFFCPCLAVIVQHLNISQNIAGVTFLAFGNGAPDIFSSIASVLSTSTPKEGLALGALLGAAIFLSTIIVATVTIIEPFDVMRRPLIRDLLFFLGTLTWCFYVLYQHRITVYEACGFIGMYAVYALVVILGRYIRIRVRNSADRNVNVAPDEEEIIEDTDDPVVKEEPTEQTAQRPLRRMDSVMEEAQWHYNVFTHSAAPPVASHAIPTAPPSRRDSSLDSLQENIGSYARDFWIGIRVFTAEEWEESRWYSKLFMLFKMPVVLVLKVTIPVVNPEVENNGWCKPLLIVQCFLAPLLMLAAVQEATYMIKGHFPLWAAFLMAGALLSVVVVLTSSRQNAPVYHKWLAYGGFIVAVLWIYSFAREVVGIVTMIGVLSRLEDEILGLTVLAWSNSLGDLVSDVAVAKQGFPRMAISACFGGPLFNLLLGIGIPFTILTFRSPTKIFDHMKFTGTRKVLLFFLAWSLFSSLIILPMSRFRATRPYAAYLIVVYVSFLIIAVLTAEDVIVFPGDL